MNNIVIESINLAKTYQDGGSTVNVLKNASLKIFAGEMIAVVGNSGSGKSTLLHLLGGLDKPSSGKVFISGMDLSLLSEPKLCELRNRELGFIYQFHYLLTDFTALENAAMPLMLSAKKMPSYQELAKEMLAMVGLSKRIHHKVSELSGGERQRVAIARALVMRPKCILADEPTGNLDPKNATMVFDLFLDLQRQLQTSVVIVTHDQSIASRTDRLLRIQDGLIIY